MDILYLCVKKVLFIVVLVVLWIFLTSGLSQKPEIKPLPFEIKDIYPTSKEDVDPSEFYELLKEEESKLYWEKIEEERREVERKRQEYLAYLASLPKTVNFDEYIPCVECNGDNVECQYYIDKGYLAYWYGDYWHHNVGKFLELFLSINPGDTVVIGGVSYEAGLFEYGEVSSDGYALYGNTTGHDIFRDSGVELITCYGTNGTKNRQIWHLYSR